MSSSQPVIDDFVVAVVIAHETLEHSGHQTSLCAEGVSLLTLHHSLRTVTPIDNGSGIVKDQTLNLRKKCVGMLPHMPQCSVPAIVKSLVIHCRLNPFGFSRQRQKPTQITIYWYSHKICEGGGEPEQPSADTNSFHCYALHFPPIIWLMCMTVTVIQDHNLIPDILTEQAFELSLRLVRVI